MNIVLGGQTLMNVEVPLLWGKRAVIGHPDKSLSIVYLGGATAQAEIVSDRPSVGIEYAERDDGLVIFRDGEEAYLFEPKRGLLRDLSGSLPECEISGDSTRVGGSLFQGNVVIGSQVAIGVTEQGFFMGGPLPAGLARLLV